MKDVRSFEWHWLFLQVWNVKGFEMVILYLSVSVAINLRHTLINYIQEFCVQSIKQNATGLNNVASFSKLCHNPKMSGPYIERR